MRVPDKYLWAVAALGVGYYLLPRNAAAISRGRENEAPPVWPRTAGETILDQAWARGRAAGLAVRDFFDGE